MLEGTRIMKPRASFVFACVITTATTSGLQSTESWISDSQDQWNETMDSSTDLDLSKGLVKPQKKHGHFKSIVKQFQQKRKPKSLTFQQSPAWDNWSPVPNVGPKDTTNSPVFLPIADGDYWYFAAKKGAGRGYHAWRSRDMQAWRHLGLVAQSNWVTTAEFGD